MVRCIGDFAPGGKSTRQKRTLGPGYVFEIFVFVDMSVCVAGRSAESWTGIWGAWWRSAKRDFEGGRALSIGVSDSLVKIEEPADVWVVM